MFLFKAFYFIVFFAYFVGGLTIIRSVMLPTIRKVRGPDGAPPDLRQWQALVAEFRIASETLDISPVFYNYLRRFLSTLALFFIGWVLLVVASVAG